MTEGHPDTSARLDLSALPPIFILPTHLPTDDLHELEDQIFAADGALTYNPKEARIFLGRVSQRKRATFDLRSKAVWTEEASLYDMPEIDEEDPTESPSSKRRKLSNGASSSREYGRVGFESIATRDLTNHILVLKVDWLAECLKQRRITAVAPHLVYTGKIVSKPRGQRSTPAPVTYIKATPEATSTSPSSSTLLTNATQATPTASLAARPARRFHATNVSSLRTQKHPPKLRHTGTSTADSSSRAPSPSTLPPLPAWVTSHHATYSCCRSTLLCTPNAAFISQLSQIKLHRILTLDEIGVRAYSTSIASLSAYPYPITHESEILRLPGCNSRIAELWREWFDSASEEAGDEERMIQHVEMLKADPELKLLKLFYDIWGVGPDTARKFVFEKGWKDLDDLVEYGWAGLNRVQQIGVKFYEEFGLAIPRGEVEGIADVVLRHARGVKGVERGDWGGERDVVCVIVGGYRRGKRESGDVDVVLSHRDEEVTSDLVVDVVRSLESEGWITHTLTLQTSMTERGQQTLPYRGESHGGGFDSLDKALCVWQDPSWEGGEGKNPNLHRRVDIILSPWRTVGCAILGWSGGTTFQRDLRRFASKQKGWKFDSSGVRNRGTGEVVDLEGHVKGGWEDRERAVMEGIGFGYRPATERCTG